MTTNRKDLIGIAIAILIGVWLLPGCASFRHDLGFYEGQKDYKYARKYGIVKNGYGVGYVNGWIFEKSVDDLDKSMKKAQEIINGWKEQIGAK